MPRRRSRLERDRSAFGSPRVASVQSMRTASPSLIMILPGWKSPWQRRSPSGRPCKAERANSARRRGTRSDASILSRSFALRAGRLSGALTPCSRACTCPEVLATEKTVHGRLPSSVSRSGPSMRSMIRPGRPCTVVVPCTAGTRTPAARAARIAWASHSTFCCASGLRSNRNTVPSSQAKISASSPSAISCISRSLIWSPVGSGPWTELKLCPYEVGRRSFRQGGVGRR